MKVAPIAIHTNLTESSNARLRDKTSPPVPFLDSNPLFSGSDDWRNLLL